MGLHGSSTTPLHPAGRTRAGGATCSARSARATRSPSTSSTTAASSSRRCAAAGRARAIGEAAAYAAQRKQFGQPIASFGAIRHKLAEMAIREFAVEAMLYRTAGPDRRAPSTAAHESDARAGGARRVRDRGVDPQSRGQRDARLRGRRERPDSRRQRLRPRLPRRAATIATRASTASSKAPTRSTAC